MKRKLIREALRTAVRYAPSHQQRIVGGYLHYSFIIQDNRIMAWGTNRTGEPPIAFGYHSKLPFPKLHSELVAYRRAKGILTDRFELINIRLNRSGHLRLSAPCSVCLQWLEALGCVGGVYSLTTLITNTTTSFESFVL